MKISRKYKKKRISYKFKQINRKKKTRIKRKYKNKKRTNKKLGGSGVLINEGNMASSRKFLFFMENSTLTFITYGSNGLTVLATLNPQKISPYSSMDPSTYGNPINKIIIKFIVISVIPTIIPLNNGKLNSTLLNQVCDELNIQTDVTLKTMNYLEPISPSPLYFNGKIDYTYLIHTIKPRIVDDGSIGQQILKKTIDDMIQFIDTTEPKNRSRAISIIGMEYAENYNILFRFLNDPNYEQYFYMSAYLIIKLAVDTGYAHGDYHQSNIMINTTKTNYFDGIVGAPLLLDYGYSSKIPIIILNGIKKLFLNKNYTKILEIISSIPRKDGLNLKKYPSFYGYLYMGFKPDANHQIERLFQLREIAIQKLTQQFQNLHTSEPSKYPLLPLSNSIKNKLFSGVDNLNKIVTPKFEFKNITTIFKKLYKNNFITENITEKELEEAEAKFEKELEKRLKNMFAQLFDWLYNIFQVAFNNVYSNSQNNCFFIKTCYNFIYILNNYSVILTQDENEKIRSFLQLFALISLLFIENFNIEKNSGGFYAIDYLTFICANAYTSEMIIDKLNKTYPLFEHKTLAFLEYAPYFANTYSKKSDLIELMLNPIMYTNPQSLLYFNGPIQPAISVSGQNEAYEFPFTEEAKSEEGKTEAKSEKSEEKSEEK